MAKRSKKRLTRQNKDQAGCMWGLINIFDFRHGRTTRRLLSDRRHVTKNTVDPTSEVNLLTSSEETPVTVENVTEDKKPTFDIIKTSVKELMEEEMIIEQDSTKQTNSDEIEFFDSKHEKTSRKSFNSDEIDINYQIPSQKTTPYHDLEALMKEILLVYQKKHKRVNDIATGSNRAFSLLEEKLKLAVEMFMNETSSDWVHESTDFIDAFQMLSSNKELFLKLLQDQNVNQEDVHINHEQKSKSKSKSRSSPLENESSLDEHVTRKPRNFFRRRSKSHEIISLNGNESPFPSNKIVILKPSSPDIRPKTENYEKSSHFSFMEIKKRLKNAIGKDQPKKMVLETSSAWSSPNRDHFYTERFSKRVERVSKSHEYESIQTKNEENGDTSQRISNIYIEAKKHLSEMFSGGDEDAELTIERLPKTLGRILTLSEYNLVSPSSSPKRDDESQSSQPCSTSVDLEEKPKVCDDSSSRQEDVIFEGVLAIGKLENQEEMEVADDLCEPCCSSESIDDDENGEILEGFSEERSPQCSKSDLHEENGFSSPTESLLANKTEEPESSTSDKTGRPSPVSILEPLFSDNEVSPSSTGSRHAEASIQPLRINFEDHETCIQNCTQNEESASEYIEAVLLASDLNWYEFEERWLSSTTILDPSLFNEVEIFSTRPYYDQKLLFDSTNEILDELCDYYLDISFINQNVKRVPNGINLINEVWERIESRLYSDDSRPLDQLVMEDLGVSRTKWMDLHLDSREIGFEIDEWIFEDMIDELCQE